MTAYCEECAKYIEIGELGIHITSQDDWWVERGAILSKELEHIGRLDKAPSRSYDFYKSPHGCIIVVGGYWGSQVDPASIIIKCTKESENAQQLYEEYEEIKRFRREFQEAE